MGSRVLITVLLVFLFSVQPALAETSGVGAGSPGVSNTFSRGDGWTSRWHVGLWYNRYDVTKPEGRFQQPGLLSLNAGFDNAYDFHPLYVGFDADLYTPQILWKSIGLGLFYLTCFVFTGGKCHADVAFSTGDRDAGMISGGAMLGVNLADFSEVPVRVYVGPDFGIFHSGFTPRPYSTVFLKGGVAYDITPDIGLDLSVRRSVFMQQWDFGSDNGITDPSLWLMTLNLEIRR